jgi:hypothetical protein
MNCEREMRLIAFNPWRLRQGPFQVAASAPQRFAPGGRRASAAASQDIEAPPS